MTAEPARPGQSVDDIPTPALLLDLDAFEANLRAMQRITGDASVALRPHGKAHRCSAIAARQVAAGAAGICCQTVGEAEVFIAAGVVSDVLVANVVIDPDKLRRIAVLAGRAKLAVCVDDARMVDALSAAAARAGTTIEVLVEVDVGDHRLGVAEPADVVRLATAIGRAPGLTFGGIQAYLGGAQHEREPDERRKRAEHAAAAARRMRDALVAADIPCPRITGGGTGTVADDCAIGVFTEVQPGSYVFLDADYARNGIAAETVRFRQALFVLAEVISVAVKGHVVCNAGLKSFSMESGLPTIDAEPGLRPIRVSDEHTRIACDGAQPPLGHRVMLTPGHCDPTVNLHTQIVGFRSGVVEAVWPIDARGASA